MPADVIAFAAHPDDLEVAMGAPGRRTARDRSAVLRPLSDGAALAPFRLRRYRAEDQYVGSLMGVAYAEPFMARTPLLVESPLAFDKVRFG
jgi:hypothetical protein